MSVKSYISEHWDDCIMSQTEDEDGYIGVPYPFIVPTANSTFREIYYWDTFFTIKGLLLDGRFDIAKSTVDDMLYLVQRFGYMPNGNRECYLYRSQPPFLSMMAADIYKASNDKIWLKEAVDILKTEYEYWMNKRITPVGLNTYGTDVPPENEGYRDLADCLSRRVGLPLDGMETDRRVKVMGAECESGWDCSPRTALCGHEFCWVDLNSNLYMYEMNFAEFSDILNLGEREYWEQRANERAEKMSKLMFTDKGFTDYNYKTGKTSPVFSCASFYPLFAGLAAKRQAQITVDNLSRIEFEYGIAACEKNDVTGTYQWDYPNGWAPLFYMVSMGLDRYGYKTEAKRIAEKYVSLVERNFEETGTLWEKYNVVSGNLNVNNEYEMPAMMGWSAGVYLALMDYLEK